MTALTFVSLTCDGRCGDYLETGGHDVRSARLWAAERENWVLSASGLDLCPSCAQMWEADQ